MKTTLVPDISNHGAQRSARPTLLLCALCLVAALTAQAALPPVVTGVVAAQGSTNQNVYINYTLSAADSTSANVGILVSSDYGGTWSVPASTFTGAVGVVPVSTTPTVNAVTWNAGADWPGHYSQSCRVRVVACNNGMVFVPEGSYLRGNPPALNDTDITDAPQYPVSVDGFLIDANLVSGGLWNYVVETYAQWLLYSFDNAGSYKAPDHPVQTISWYDAIKWCNARSEMEGLTPVYYYDSSCTAVYRSSSSPPVYMRTGVNGYRLPTEAEWERAARDGFNGARFPWHWIGGSGPVATAWWDLANYKASAVAYDYLFYTTWNGSQATEHSAQAGDYCFFFYTDSATTGNYSTLGPTVPYTSPVAYRGFPPDDRYGLRDMAGNVNEWCWDWYSSSYYASGQTNPQGPSSGTAQTPRG